MPIPRNLVKSVSGFCQRKCANCVRNGLRNRNGWDSVECTSHAMLDVVDEYLRQNPGQIDEGEKHFFVSFVKDSDGTFGNAVVSQKEEVKDSGGVDELCGKIEEIVGENIVMLNYRRM